MTTTRDKIAHAVSNWVLNTFATEEYREKVEFTYVLGLEELGQRRAGNEARAMVGHPFREETR